MAKDGFEPRMSFSHGRAKPVVVEKLKRRTSADLVCPSCGAKMRLQRSAESLKFTASCPRCAE
jgi:hypothetical protein